MNKILFGMFVGILIGSLMAPVIAQVSTALYGIDSSGTIRRIRCTATAGSLTDCDL